MKEFNPLFLTDFYKVCHRLQYPQGTELVYSNFTPRKSRSNIDKMVFFGLQYVMKEYLVRQFNKNFFNKPKEEVVQQYERMMKHTIGELSVEHVEQLHDLGYLPIQINALPEGTKVPMGVPCFTIWNTKPEFFWLTNYLETMLSNTLWKSCNSATTALEHRKGFEEYAEITGALKEFVDWQGHDFSYRGMGGTEDMMLSGAGHILSFTGTDSLPVIWFIEEYYNTNIEEYLVGGSVFATEHSVQCAGEKHGEFDTFKRLITEIHPQGILSIVSDTWDLWQVLTDFLPRLKDDILKRHDNNPMNKIVIRPDSGTPNLILNGNPDGSSEPEKKGVIRLLDEVFGHTINTKGYKTLHPTIGAIYGDGINHEERHKILSGIEKNGYSTDCVVLGLGSFTYVYTTRDEYGLAMKAVYCEVNGEGRELFKEPVTGAWKKSHKGLLRVNNVDGELQVEQQVSWDRQGGLMTPVFKDGKILKEYTLEEIRKTVKE